MPSCAKLKLSPLCNICCFSKQIYFGSKEGNRKNMDPYSENKYLGLHYKQPCFGLQLPNMENSYLVTHNQNLKIFYPKLYHTLKSLYTPVIAQSYIHLLRSKSHQLQRILLAGHCKDQDVWNHTSEKHYIYRCVCVCVRKQTHIYLFQSPHADYCDEICVAIELMHSNLRTECVCLRSHVYIFLKQLLP